MKPRKTQTVTDLTTIPFTHRVAWDDGAGNGKMLVRSVESGKETRHIDRAIHGMSTWADLGIEGQRDKPIQIVEAILENGEYSIPEHPIVYGFGHQMLYQGDMAHDTTAARYTGTGADVRFHAMLSQTLDTTEAVIDLNVGLNANQFKQASEREAVRRFFLREHVFKADGTTYRVLVANVTVYPQPWSAIRYIKNNPPVELAARIARFPIERMTSVTLDGGRSTTDLVVMMPDPENPGKLKMAHIFALDESVSTMVARVSAKIEDVTGIRPTLRLAEQVFTTGILPTAGESIDLRHFVDQTKKAVWESMFTQVSGILRDAGVEMHYFFCVGGLAHVAREAILDTKIRGGKFLRDMPGFHIPEEPEWTVCRGYLEA
jgi:hypothetical protein